MSCDQVVSRVSAQRDEEGGAKRERMELGSWGQRGDSTGQIVLYCVTDRALCQAAEEQGCLDSERMTIL